jgi:hypothetical protein
MRQVLIIEMRENERAVQRVVPLEELPLQATCGGRQVAWDIKNALKSTPDWAINIGLAQLEEKELRELQRGKLRYDFNAQATVRAR